MGYGVRFIHAADIHLGSPLGGLDLRDDAPKQEIRAAPRRAFARLVDYCIENSIDLLLISGDLFDGRAEVDTQIFAEGQLRRLSESGVRCVLLRGNHDAASKQVLKFRLPELANELSVERAESIQIEELGVVVHGRGFAQQHVTEQLVTEYPDALPGYFNIGMLHTSASGTSGHEVYAPCSVEQLLVKHYDYWALGHIHKRQILVSDPPVVFCGNLQGRHPGETGEKGATFVAVEKGVIVDGPKHIDFDVVRWHTITVDLTGSDDEDAALNAVEQQLRLLVASGGAELLHAVRIDCVGRTALHRVIVDSPTLWRDKVQQVVADAGGDRVWVERLAFDTSPPLPPLPTIRAREDMVGDLARELGSLSRAGEIPKELQGAFELLANKLGPLFKDGGDMIAVPGITADVPVSGLLETVERDLLGRLIDAEVASDRSGD